MSEISSYVEYLPSVLWSRESDPAQFLGRMLRIFEKILTGIDDQVPLTHGGREYASLEQTIDELHQLFNPWRTRADLLAALASWVGLDLPDGWSEYQQRRLLTEMVSIYQRRGTKEGLLAYLEVYGAGNGRPRLAIDEGEALFHARFADDGTARLYAILHTDTVTVGNSSVTVLLHPSAIAVDQDNNYIVADQGAPSVAPALQPALWRVSSAGEIVYRVPKKSSPQIPLPQPIHAGQPLQRPVAVVVDKQGRYIVLDAGAIHRLAPPSYELETLFTTTTPPAFPAIYPVDMALDPDDRLVVLDRGTPLSGDPPSGPSAKPKIYIISQNPLSITASRAFTEQEITEPTALIIDGQGRLIVADAKNQSATDDQPNPIPADLLLVDPINWSVTPLLKGLSVQQNPLIFPTGLIIESPRSLLVCDTGVRWGYGGDDPMERFMAEPAALYRVDLGSEPPMITRVTRDRKLVQPAKMALDRRGRLLIADRGEASRGNPALEWRAGPHQFGVVVLFSQQRPNPPLIETRNRIRQGLMDLVAAERPADTLAWLDL